MDDEGRQGEEGVDRRRGWGRGQATSGMRARAARSSGFTSRLRER